MGSRLNVFLITLTKLLQTCLSHSQSVMSCLRKFTTQSFAEVQNEIQHYKHNGKSQYEFKFPYPSWSVLGLGACAGTGKPVNSDWNKEKDVAHQIALAEIAIKEGNLKKAEKLLEEALIISNKTQTIGVTCVYDMLATLAYRQGEVSKAENILVQVIQRLLEMGLSQDHNMVVNFSLKLARIYNNLGQDDLAEIGFRNCLAIQKKKYLSGQRDEETAMLWINSLFWYGKFLASRKKYHDAKQCFDSAYTMCAHVKSIDSNQVMVMLYNLGEMSYATGDVDGALRHLLNAVILGRTINSPDLPTYYTKIGIIYLHKGVLSEAKHWCENGKQTGKRMHDKSASKEAIECLEELAKLNWQKA